MTEVPDDSYADYMDTRPDAPVVVEIATRSPLPVEERPSRQWTCGQVQVRLDVVVQLAGGHPSRHRLTVKNMGDSPVIVAPDVPTCTPTSGYPLDPGEKLEFVTRHPVYATSTSADSVVAFLAHHLDG